MKRLRQPPFHRAARKHWLLPEMPSLRLACAIGLLGAADPARAVTVGVDFESVPSLTFVDDTYVMSGLLVSGTGPLSGLVISVGDFGTGYFGNSGTQIVHAGAREQPTTLWFVDPNDPLIVVGAESVAFLAGDGNADSETFAVTYLDLAGGVLSEPTIHTTTGEGLWFFATSGGLGGAIGGVEVRLAAASASGVTFDDVSFELSIPVTEIGPSCVPPVSALHIAPNPFRDRTRIAFDRPDGAVERIEIFDINGRRVRRLLIGVRTSSIIWNGRDQEGALLPAGVYFVRITDPDTETTRRVVIAR